MKKLLPFITLLLGILFTCGAYFILFKPQESLKPQFLNFHMFNVPKEVKAFELESENKQIVTNEKLLNNWTVINFGYTSCPDICPTNLADASILQRILEEDMNITKGFQSWFITIDPARDTREVISNYTNAFHSELLGLRATEKNTQDFALQFGFSFILQNPVDDAQEVYWISHSDMMVLINPDGKYAGYILPPYDSENLALALERLIEDGSLY